MPFTNAPNEINEHAWRLDLLQWQIQSKHHDFRQGFYHALFKLYANIGRICSKYLEQHPVNPAMALHKLSGNLVYRYGRLFEIKQLKQMMLFAQQHQPYPLMGNRDLLYFNWDYLAILLPIIDREEQQFYMRATAAKKWNLAELEQHIAASDYHNPKVFRGLKARALRYPISTGKKKKLLERQLSVWRLYGDIKNMPFPNAFVEPTLSDFVPLLQPQADEQQFTYTQFNEGLQADNLDSIALYLIQFREEVNRNLNNGFNHFLWNLGDLLTLPSGFSDTLSETLRQLYGQFFNADHIEAIRAYHSHVTDRDIEHNMSSKLTWSHIISLLPVQSNDAKLFYTELAHEDDLSPDELRQRIKSDWYEQALAKYNEQHEPADTAPIKQKQIEKTVTGNITMVVEHIAVNEDDIRPSNHNLNILHNPYFMQFMASAIN